MSLRQRNVKSKECLVLITQTCDLVATDEEEPYVEALICKVDKRQEYLDLLDRNSARWFVVDRPRGIVAWAMYRVVLVKKLLEGLTPEPLSADPRDRLRRERFISWLARRYDRPELPDKLVVAFQTPVNTLFDDLVKQNSTLVAAFNRAVREVRVSNPPNEKPPFELHLLLWIRDGLSAEEDDAIEAVVDQIRTVVDASIILLHPQVDRLIEEEISLAQYFATRPLYLEYLTYRGDEIQGSPPQGRA